MGCVLCSEVVWERSEVGGRTIRSGCELGNREECFQRWRVLAMGPLAAAARFGRGKHHCHLICALGRWRRRWCRWWWWCWSECRRRVAAVRSEFGFRDGWSREICCCCNGIGSSRGARASTLKQSQITLSIMATTLSLSAQVSFSAWCFFPLPTIPQFLSLLLSLFDSSILSLSVFFLPRLKISPILCGLHSQILIIRTVLRAWVMWLWWSSPPTLLPRTLKRRQAAGGETWSAPVGKMEGERVTDEERKKEEGGDGGRWIEAVQKLIGLTMCFVFGCWIVTLATFPTTHMLNYLNTSVLMNKSTSFGFSGTPTFVF